MTKVLGIIAAQGILPIMVSDNNASVDGRSIIACIEGLASKGDYKNHIAQEFPIGKISAIIKYFKENDVKKIVICGAMKRPNFSALSVDAKGAILLAKILAAKILGDDQLLRIVAEYLEGQGFKIVAPIDYTNQVPIKTKHAPSKRESNDIELGLKAAKILGDLDIGQAVIVADGAVIGVEAIEGTDALIKRCAGFGKSGILVKCLKPTQDPRLDTPVIGVDTVKAVHESGMAGIAISGVITLNPEEVVAEANRLGIFVIEGGISIPRRRPGA